ncbi:GNAT family N-acetyltransferase [Flavobacterium piscinae]|uniref:GNAT family N-acetyltransferase n=1 Tax=Flavobacterium piscinae TaxID=2506424 RepID=UPI002AAB448B|nr:hypothetical protein [Flavobacterium piscinae]
MTIQIRPYAEADVTAILDIINDNILHSTSLYDYEPRSLAKQSDLLKEKNSQTFSGDCGRNGWQNSRIWYVW